MGGRFCGLDMSHRVEQRIQEEMAMMDVFLPKKEAIEKVRREKNALFLEQETGLLRQDQPQAGTH